MFRVLSTPARAGTLLYCLVYLQLSYTRVNNNMFLLEILTKVKNNYFNGNNNDKNPRIDQVF